MLAELRRRTIESQRRVAEPHRAHYLRHFAGQWDHIWDYDPHYKGQKYIDLWPKTYDLLQRAIAIPIMIKMDDDQITKIAESIKDGLGQLQPSS